MSKTIEKLKAAARRLEDPAKDPEKDPEKDPKDAEGGEEDPEKDPKDAEDPENGGDGGGDPEKDPEKDPEGGEEDPEKDPKDAEDDEDGEAKAIAAIVAENAALKGRVALLEKAFKAEKAESARLRSALADPSFRYAAMRPQNVPASAVPDAAATEQKKLAADLAACKTPEERIALLKSRKR